MFLLFINNSLENSSKSKYIEFNRKVYKPINFNRIMERFTLEDIKSYLSALGNFAVDTFQKIVIWISELGLNVTEFQARIISLCVLFFGLFVVFKFVELGRKFIKWIILVLILVLIASIIVGFF